MSMHLYMRCTCHFNSRAHENTFCSQIILKKKRKKRIIKNISVIIMKSTPTQPDRLRLVIKLVIWFILYFVFSEQWLFWTACPIFCNFLHSTVGTWQSQGHRSADFLQSDRQSLFLAAIVFLQLHTFVNYISKLYFIQGKKKRKRKTNKLIIYIAIATWDRIFMSSSSRLFLGTSPFFWAQPNPRKIM